MGDVIKYRFRCRRRTAAEWTSVNEVLLAQEIGLEEDTGLGKIGNGSTAWNDLLYTIVGQVDLSGLADGKCLAWDAANKKWYVADRGVAYTAGNGITIDGSNPNAPVISSGLGNIHIDGQVANYADLPSPPPSGDTTYYVAGDGLVYIWDGTTYPSQGLGITFGQPLSVYTGTGAPGTGTKPAPQKYDKLLSFLSDGKTYLVPAIEVVSGGSGFIKIQIDKTKVSGTNSDYILYVNLADMPAVGFWDTVKNGGGDIRVFKDSAKSTEFPREVVTCDTATLTGELHVKMDQIDDVTGGVLYLQVDGTSNDYAVTDPYGRNAVWTDYFLVSHNGGASDDSTGAGNVGVPYGGVSAGGGAGQLGKSTVFDGVNDYVSIPNTTNLGVIGNLTTPFTVSFWAKTAATSDTAFTAKLDTTGSSTGKLPFLLDISSGCRLGYRGSDGSFRSITRGTSVFGDGNFHHIVASRGITPSITTSLFTDGFNAGTNTGDLTTDSSGSFAITLGLLINGPAGPQWYLNGALCEYRICKSQRSSDWVLTEYANQSSPSSFYSATLV